MVLIHQVNLNDEDRRKLHDLLKVGEHSARSVACGYILLLASQGKSNDCETAVCSTSKRQAQRRHRLRAYYDARSGSERAKEAAKQ